MPNAALDEKLYPKEVIAAFNQARQNARESAGDIAEVYARFHPAPGATPAADEHWTLTPVRYLMTGEEKTRWAELQTNEDRAAFVTEFWAKRDPSAGTPENEFRSEFERRVLFCDAAFAAAEQRGSETDTAVVFTFFGAPSYVRATELQNEEMDALRGRAQGQNLPSRQGLNGSRSRARPTHAGTHSLEGAARRGRRETWHYRKDRLPSIVAFQEIEFAFTTRKGYGERVLDRDERGLLALETLAENVAKTLKLN